MKRFLIILIAASLFSSMAHAAPITFIDTTLFTATGTTESSDLTGYGGVEVNRLEEFLDFVSWNHNFTVAPAAAEILGATLRLYLLDDERDAFLNPYTWEIGFGITESGQWDVGAVNTGTYAYDVNIASVEDGTFGVLLKSLGGDFLIQKSELEVEYQPVPEPGTVFLLGAGLLALGFFGRRRSAQKAA